MSAGHPPKARHRAGRDATRFRDATGPRDVITRSLAADDERRPGRHAAPRRLRRGWIVAPLLTAASVLVSALVFASPAARGVSQGDDPAATPLAVRALGVDTAAAAVGEPVTVGVTVAARGSQAVDRVVVAVRDQAGTNVDFPPELAWRLDDEEQVYLATRVFAAAGTYTYWFAYQQGGRWTDLTPRRTFTVTRD